MIVKPSGTAGLVTCPHCDAGFRRQLGGFHNGSQRKGMIPPVACERVFASHGGAMTEDNERPWMAYVDGDVIRKKSGDGRRFATAEAAYRAACKAAPYKEHT